MIHQYKLNGYNIVLDVCSGAIHCTDDLAYDIIAYFEDFSREDVAEKIFAEYPTLTKAEFDECYDAVGSLKEQGKLFTPDRYEPLAGNLKQKAGNVIKALCLHVSHSCNLNCAYCFASQGNFGGKRSLMSFETGKQALDFLVAHSGTRHNLEVDFFGGEPLLNWDVCKQLVEYARSIEKAAGKRFRFTLTTNGVDIDDDVIDFANREMHNVVLSLDGRKEIHDRFRVDYSGRGSFDTVVPKFQKLVNARGGKNYYMRGTFTHANPDFLADIKTMLDLGFTELSMEPVICAPDDPSALTPADIEIVKQQYEELALLMIDRRKAGKPFTFYHYMIDLTGGPCIYKRISGCGSGTEYMAVTPEGDLYPCHRFVGKDDFCLGNVYDGVTNKAQVDVFRSSNVYQKPECQDCWAKLYCSGGCAANAYDASGSVNGIYKPGCELFKKRIECAIMVKLDEAFNHDDADR